MSEPLFIDGGISANDRVAREACVVGVVKSSPNISTPRGGGLQVGVASSRRRTTTAFRVTSTKRTTVASWYLRLRDPLGRDPMWGLVRVEIAEPPPARRRPRFANVPMRYRGRFSPKWFLPRAARFAMGPKWSMEFVTARNSSAR